MITSLAAFQRGNRPDLKNRVNGECHLDEATMMVNLVIKLLGVSSEDLRAMSYLEFTSHLRRLQGHTVMVTKVDQGDTTDGRTWIDWDLVPVIAA